MITSPIQHVRRIKNPPRFDRGVMATHHVFLAASFFLAGLIYVDASSYSYASEPLRGPEVGIQGWLEHEDENRNTNRVVKIRHLDADLPIPVPLWIAMPFATLRLKDRIVDTQPKYLTHHSLVSGSCTMQLRATQPGVLTLFALVR